MTDRLRYNPLVKRGFQFYNTGAESGLPTGGTTGQVIKKASNADFDVTWGADNASGFSEVNIFADLPTATGSGDIYLVLASSGVWLINRKTAGFYKDTAPSTWTFVGDFPVSHTQLQDVGTKTHAQIEADIAIDASGFNGNLNNTVTNAQKLAEAVDQLSTSAAAPTYTNALPSAITVGGIAAGTTFSNKTMTQMFDDMLYPELNPTLTAPSSTFTLTQEGLQEIGAVITTLNFGATFSRGSISPAYTTSGFRAGSPNQYTYTGTGLSNKALTALTDSNTVSNYTVAAGAQSWTGRVAYDAGPQPLSSKGNNYNTPLAAGNTGIVTRTITGVYPFFATTVGITTQTKQALVAHNSTYFAASMVAESGSDKQTARFPAAFSAVVGIQFYNTVSSAWEYLGGSKANSLLLFTVTDVNITVNSVSVAYKKYTHNSSTIGARQLRFYTV